jgi:acyl-CoA synthetase (AMP-forming)/AMP-acid ligase II
VFGLMQEHPLLTSSLLANAGRYHAATEIVTVTVAEGKHRYTYGDCEARSRQLADALLRWGMKSGDRMGTLAWNGYRHMEVWFGVGGGGGVVHTINPRLFKEQIVYIINHAEDRILFVDVNFAGLVEQIWDELSSVELVVFLTDDAHMPQTKLPKVKSYESFLATGSRDYQWPVLDERQAVGLCYTSGTTGNPKGVLYSHRSTVINAYASALPDTFGAGAADVMMPAVPMFHANAWAMPYIAVVVGARLVHPGPHLDGKSLHTLMTEEGVTVSAGVPTVWLSYLAYIKETGKDTGTLRKLLVGGSAAPASMIETFASYGVKLMHAWGMTELSPLGTVNMPTYRTSKLSGEARRAVEIKQGRPVCGIDIRITDDNGNELPWDGKTVGHLEVKGHWVIQSYFKSEGKPAVNKDGWFDTGDIATIDSDGYVALTDRAKDLIKSGGEWISSIDLENTAMGHPQVAEAAVIAVPHPKWGERPLLIIVPKKGTYPDKEDIRRFLDDKVARWWMPDDIVFIDDMPHTATGKIQKMTLRERFKDYQLPTV